MKNQYFGDRRDYFKYDLLLEIMENISILKQLTFIPMLTPNDHSTDGRLTEYSSQKRREDLYNFLQTSLKSNNRNIVYLRDFLKGKGFTFNPYRETEFFSHSDRSEYFEAIPNRYFNDSLFFIDPDNGLEVKSMRPSNGQKYIRFSELKSIFSKASDNSIIVLYQHLPRINRALYYSSISSKLKSILDSGNAIYLSDNEIAFVIITKNIETHETINNLMQEYSNRHKLTVGELYKSSLQKRPNFYDPFNCMSFTYNNCYLCGQTFQITEEHVFPKWLLRKYDLWNRNIVLLNGTKIPYKQLKVPCCSNCNNKFLSKLELKISSAIKGGFSKFKKLDEVLVFQWLSKIYYGILFKELSLLFDQANPSQGTIISEEYLQKMRVFHTFLQSIRMPFNFEAKPWSIFVFNLLDDGGERNFDYRDGLGLVASIRLSDIGIICCFQDNGSQKKYSGFNESPQGSKLQDMQFIECYARIAYQAYLLNRTPKYIFIQGQKADLVTVVSPSLQGFSNKPIYDQWDQKYYAKLLTHCWAMFGMTFNQVFRSPNQVYTTLRGSQGEFLIGEIDDESII